MNSDLPNGVLNSRASRRALLVGASALAGALGLAGVAGAQQASPSPTIPADPTKVEGRPPDQMGQRSPFVHLQRLAAPFWSFAPLGDLEGVITPSALHFERHHNGVPAIDPAKYSLTIHGLVDRPTVFTLADLKRFPAVSRIMFLECSGNSLWAWLPAKASDTAQSIHGLTSTSEWTGVPVSLLLKEVGVKAGASWALAEGGDAAVMDRSIPVQKLMADAFIAYAQNGEPIRPEQGFPARLMLPGWEGNTNIKWLRRIELSDQPFMSREETDKYTDAMPNGKERQFTFVMEANSIITRPSGGQFIPALGPWEISGIAWSGRGRITRVEVSTDAGKSWRPAVLDPLVLPIAHTRFRLPWRWDGQPAILQSRATDETGYLQPTRAQLVAVRGTGSVYHYNGIQSWKVNSNGMVSNVYA
ncbi:MAG: sulfite dehydrogenase [Chloroflexota bacterium]